jgi:hypothetical protein
MPGLRCPGGLALSRAGPHGLVHLDGHTDFRHPGNSAACANLAGVDLAAVVGLHCPAIAVTVFDPDLDPDGKYARLLSSILAEGLRHLGADHDAAAR